MDSENEIKSEEEISTEAPTSEEESKVPYSRFKKFHERAIAAEQRAAVAEENYQRALSERSSQEERPTESNDSKYRSWKKLFYGSETVPETDVMRGQYELYMKEFAPHSMSSEDIRREAREAYREEQKFESTRVNDNIETIDSNLEDLTDLVGRNLTEDEQSGILDIVDEFTPKDSEGNYLGAILPFDKAWEVYEMRQKNQSAGRRDSRDRVASLNGATSSGEPNSMQSEQDKSFVPGRWGSWRDKLK